MIANTETRRTPRAFLPADAGRIFNANFLDESACRGWILEYIHGAQDGSEGQKTIFCPGCQAILEGKALQRFWTGKRICCRKCGKFFTALTGTFLAGCHMKYREILLFALFLNFKIPPREIARILRISTETIRLWEIKFNALGRLQDMAKQSPIDAATRFFLDEDQLNA